MHRTPTSSTPFLTHVATTIAVVQCLLFFNSDASAQSPCDPSLAVNASQTTGYQRRADRCEGVYRRDVSSFGVQLVALMASVSTSSICSAGTTTHVLWRRPRFARNEIRVRAESLRRNLFYRLDTSRPPEALSYQWPREPRCDNEINLGVNEVAILATTDAVINARPTTILLPVGVSTDTNTVIGPPYRAALIPGRRVKEVYVSLWKYRSDSQPQQVLLDRPLQAQPYPTDRPMYLELGTQEVPERAVYRVRANIEFESGDIESIEFFFDG